MNVFWKGWFIIFFSEKTIFSQPFGPTEPQQLTTPSAHQEFCVYPRKKYVHSNVNPVKSVTLQESELCILYCTLEPNCFFTEYNPTNKLCKMFSFLTGCGNLKNKGSEHIFSWRTSFISTLSTRDLCEYISTRSVSKGGGCTAKSGQSLQWYSDQDYYRKYGAITAVAVWKKGFFRAIQLR